MEKTRDITIAEIYESIKDVCVSLNDVKNIVNALDKCTKELTGGIPILEDVEPALIRTRGFDNFYKNTLNCMKSKKFKDNVYYLTKYVFDVEANRTELEKLSKGCVGLTTPVTKRIIKTPSLTDSEKKNLDDKEKINRYVQNVMELFDCCKEIITYDNYIMPIDKENKSKVIAAVISIMDSIYTLLRDDMKLRFYSRKAYDELSKIVKAVEKGTGSLIKLDDQERLIKELNENIILENKDIKDLYGNLVLRFVNHYNDLIIVNKARSYSTELVKKLKGTNEDDAEKKLDSVSKVMLRKLDKHKDNELFLIILEYLLDEEGKKAWEGNSYEYYCAINGLSMDCSSYMYDKGIYSDANRAKEELAKVNMI